MAGVGGYGYQSTIGVYTSNWGTDIVSVYIADDNEVPASETKPNITTGLYFGATSQDCNVFEKSNSFVSLNDSNVKYKYSFFKADNSASFLLKDENDLNVESVNLNCPNNDGNTNYYNFNLILRLSYADIENPTITQAGFCCTSDGISAYGPLVLYNVVWFTESKTYEILNDCIVTRKVKEGGTVVTRLKQSENFIITTLPAGIFQKSEIAVDNQFYSDMIPLSDEIESYYQNIWAWHPLNTYARFSPDNQFASPFGVHQQFLTYYGSAVGSDMLRKDETSVRPYNNAGDITTFNSITINDTSKLFRISFEGGYAEWRHQTTSGQSAKYLDFYNENGTLLDTWHVNGSNTSPQSSQPNENRRINVSTAFLCKSGSNYYIVGNIVYIYCKDADSNAIPDSYYYCSGGYVILKKLNQQASTLLNNATETIAEYDKTDVDDTSEEGSMPTNTGDLNDRTSHWSDGEHAGENSGIRHNGSDKIDASNGELTGDSPVGKIKTPAESGEQRIPTPLNTGMITGLAPTIEEMETFSGILSQDSFLQIITQFLSNPADCIISAHTCIAPALDKGDDVYLNYGTWSSQTSNLHMKKLTNQYYHCQMGTLALEEKRNSYKDYPPFCNYQIYLPYIGVRDIDGRIVVGKLLKLYYHINVLTGDILAELEVTNENSQISSSFYYWQGNTYSPFPLKSVDYSSMIQNSISAILTTGTAIATGVGGVAVAGSLTGAHATAKMASTVASGINSAGSVGSDLSKAFHPDIRLMGTISGNMSQLMFDTPYIIRTYPYLSETNPLNYERLAGLPSNIGNTLIDNYVNNKPMYIKFKAQDLDKVKTNRKSFYATEDEKNEIASLLEQGVYI